MVDWGLNIKLPAILLSLPLSLYFSLPHLSPLSLALSPLSLRGLKGHRLRKACGLVNQQVNWQFSNFPAVVHFTPGCPDLHFWRRSGGTVWNLTFTFLQAKWPRSSSAFKSLRSSCLNLEPAHPNEVHCFPRVLRAVSRLLSQLCSL